jgi:hypothetical protein
MTTEIKEEEMISVPRGVLQSLVWNCELAIAGMGAGEKLVARQCRDLERYLQAGLPDETELSFEEFKNVEFVNFRKSV